MNLAHVLAPPPSDFDWRSAPLKPFSDRFAGRLTMIPSVRCKTAAPTIPSPARRFFSEEEREWVKISFDYRLLYYFKIYPAETFLAWKGACWCSQEKIGAFSYGPGPDDPSLPAKTILRFFQQHNNLIHRIDPPGRKLALADENQLNRSCLVLGMFERIVRKGLFNCNSLPLFKTRPNAASDLDAVPENHLVQEMTRLSSRYYSEFREMDMDIARRLQEKYRIPAESPLQKCLGDRRCDLQRLTVP
ncbi:MAG: hypothetical protein JXR73_13410 [Candidatus Omnitrophica bacterium]|nr:hypothetical protein [Candidatus Omnitrophota bacterium]